MTPKIYLFTARMLVKTIKIKHPTNKTLYCSSFNILFKNNLLYFRYTNKNYV